MAPAASCIVWRLPSARGPGIATRNTAPPAVAERATGRPSITRCQSPGFSGRLTLTTSFGCGDTCGSGAESTDVPSSSMASTLTTGIGFSSVARRPPSNKIPVVIAPAPTKTGRRMRREYRWLPAPRQTLAVAPTEAQPLGAYTGTPLSAFADLVRRRRGRKKIVDVLDILRRQAGRFQCPKCGQSLAECQLEMVTHHDDQPLVKVTCAHCQDTRLIAVAFAAETETEAPAIDVRDEPAEDLGVAIS